MSAVQKLVCLVGSSIGLKPLALLWLAGAERKLCLIECLNLMQKPTNALGFAVMPRRLSLLKQTLGNPIMFLIFCQRSLASYDF